METFSVQVIAIGLLNVTYFMVFSTLAFFVNFKLGLQLDAFCKAISFCFSLALLCMIFSSPAQARPSSGPQAAFAGA